MKKIIIKNEKSTIQLDEVKETDYIVAKKQDKIYGVIYCDDDNDWCFCKSGKNFDCNKNLIDLLDYEYIRDCEFYVMD